eukprot:1786190-Prymnesium_polylepis.3
MPTKPTAGELQEAGPPDALRCARMNASFFVGMSPSAGPAAVNGGQVTFAACMQRYDGQAGFRRRPDRVRVVQP